MDKFDILYDLMVKIDGQVGGIERNVVAIRKDLDYHILRTDLAEARIEDNERDIANHKERMDQHMRPINWKVVGTVVGIVSSAAGIAFYLTKCLL